MNVQYVDCRYWPSISLSSLPVGDRKKKGSQELIDVLIEDEDEISPLPKNADRADWKQVR